MMISVFSFCFSGFRELLIECLFFENTDIDVLYNNDGQTNIDIHKDTRKHLYISNRRSVYKRVYMGYTYKYRCGTTQYTICIGL